MSIKYSGSNVLTFLLSLLNTKFGTKVDKVDGKGLSTNDYTTDEKNKLSGIATGANAYTHPTYTQKASKLYKVTVDSTGHVSAATEVVKSDITGLGIPGQDTTYVVATSELAGLLSAADKEKLDGIAAQANKYVHPNATAKSSGFYKITVDGTGHVTAATAIEKADITALGIPGSMPTVPTISTDIEADATSNTKTASPRAVKTYVDNKVGSIYKAAGNTTFATLPTPSATVLGNVYNVTDAFNTTASFVDGANVAYPAGTNVVVVLIEGSYKFDVLSGFVDLSGYVETTDMVEYSNAEVQDLWDAVFTS